MLSRELVTLKREVPGSRPWSPSPRRTCRGNAVELFEREGMKTLVADSRPCGSGRRREVRGAKQARGKSAARDGPRDRSAAPARRAFQHGAGHLRAVTASRSSISGSRGRGGGFSLRGRD